MIFSRNRAQVCHFAAAERRLDRFAKTGVERGGETERDQQEFPAPQKGQDDDGGAGDDDRQSRQSEKRLKDDPRDDGREDLDAQMFYVWPRRDWWSRSGR
ncbi:MAG TPA: hypothetical protein VF399_08965 [bacterium]